MWELGFIKCYYVLNVTCSNIGAATFNQVPGLPTLPEQHWNIGWKLTRMCSYQENANILTSVRTLINLNNCGHCRNTLQDVTDMAANEVPTHINHKLIISSTQNIEFNAMK